MMTTESCNQEGCKMTGADIAGRAVHFLVGRRKNASAPIIVYPLPFAQFAKAEPCFKGMAASPLHGTTPDEVTLQVSDSGPSGTTEGGLEGALPAPVASTGKCALAMPPVAGSPIASINKRT